METDSRSHFFVSLLSILEMGMLTCYNISWPLTCKKTLYRSSVQHSAECSALVR